MNWSIDFAPLIPEPWLWAAAAVAAVLCVLLLLRRSRGAALRALALAAVIAALANPTLRQEDRERLANIALVVMDESTSQSHRQATGTNRCHPCGTRKEARRHP